MRRLTRKAVEVRLQRKNPSVKVLSAKDGKVTVVCPSHGEFTESYSKLMYDRTRVCLSCSRPNRYEFLTKRRFDIQKYSEYTKKELGLTLIEAKTWEDSTSVFHCDVCSQKVLASLKSVATYRKGRILGCRKCRTAHMSVSSVPKTHEEYIQRLSDNELTILPKFTFVPGKTRGKKLFYCQVCSHEYKTRVYLPLRGYGCPRCATVKTARLNQIRYRDSVPDRLQDLGFTLLTPVSKVSRVGDGRFFTVKCNTCGQTYPGVTLQLLARRKCQVCEPKQGGFRLRLRYNGHTHTGFRSTDEVGVARLLFDKFGESNVAFEAVSFRKPNTKITAGHKNTYTPDFFIRSRNFYVEVKGTATLGIVPWIGDVDVTDAQIRFQKIIRRIRWVEATGNRIRVVLYDRKRNQLVPLPANLSSLSWAEVVQILQRLKLRLPKSVRRAASSMLRSWK